LNAVCSRRLPPIDGSEMGTNEISDRTWVELGGEKTGRV
jgi:hypothetical protein